MNSPSFSIFVPEMMEMNWAGDHLIFYLLKGEGRLRVDAGEYTLVAEDFIAVEPRSIYAFLGGRDMCVLRLTMPASLLRQMTRAPERRSIRFFSGDHSQNLSGAMSSVRRKLANLFDLQYGSADPDELLFTGRAILLYDYLYAHFSVRSAEAAASDAMPGAFEYLRAVHDYVAEHACEDALLTDAAGRIGVTPIYLSRLLRKYMGVSFTDLVRRQRMRRAQELLRASDQSITDIAYATGYSAPSAFISSFKDAFGVTPRQYRTRSENLDSGERLPAKDLGTFDAIRKYIHHDAEEDVISGGLYSTQEDIRFDAAEAGRPFRDGWNRTLAVTSASDILQSDIQSQIRAANRDFGFEYLYFHDVFNDEMMIYEEDEAGNPMYNFRRLDLCLRFILSIGLKPYIELSFMPLRLARPDHGRIRFINKVNVTPPTDWDKWERLIRATVEYCARQYGIEQVRTWRFTSAMIYNVHLHQLLTLEEYLEMYLRTRRAVKAVCGDAVFTGPGADVTRIADSWDESFQPFIDFCREHDCMPDMISLRFYPIDYRRFHRDDIALLREDRRRLKKCPNYFVDEAFAHRALQKAADKLMDAGFGPDRVCIDRWNGNISQTDPSNDTCYKSAYIVKTVLENRDLVANMTYWSLSDSMLHLDFSLVESNIVGSLGLVTADGLHKSAYYGMLLLHMLHGEVLAEGNGYIALRHGNAFLLMLYQYCHYDQEAVNHALVSQEIDDPYALCVSGRRQVYTIEIKNAREEMWNAEFFSVGRHSGGNLYEKWRDFGYPGNASAWQRGYLDSAALPAYRMTEISAVNGVLRLGCVVEPHDVILIRLNPSAMVSGPAR